VPAPRTPGTIPEGDTCTNGSNAVWLDQIQPSTASIDFWTDGCRVTFRAGRPLAIEMAKAERLNLLCRGTGEQSVDISKRRDL